ncbi:MAG: hypothetical protein FWF49_03895 [Oscillospiraceae bacterium]|nr:hypothetical protein [Oscillospiraceae bacterium]
MLRKIVKIGAWVSLVMSALLCVAAWIGLVNSLQTNYPQYPFTYLVGQLFKDGDIWNVVQGFCTPVVLYGGVTLALFALAALLRKFELLDVVEK